jgi:hypothetical protein
VGVWDILGVERYTALSKMNDRVVVEIVPQDERCGGSVEHTVSGTA